MNLFNKSASVLTSVFFCFGILIVEASATETKNHTTNTPKGFDPFIWTELQKIEPKDLQQILAFGSIGDGTGTLPTLPVAMKGSDGKKGTADDVLPPHWVKLGGLLRRAQADAALAKGNAALAEANKELAEGNAALKIAEALEKAASN